jgi:membrane fusion protein (multidrug efflux system)
MNVSPVLVIAALLSLALTACHRSHGGEGEHHQEHHKIVVTSPQAKDVVVTQPYVCQIRSQRHIEVKALEEGYLEAISVREGQAVRQGEVLFRVVPALYKARLDAEVAEAKYARVELENSKRLYDQKFVSDQDLALYAAKLARAEAKAKVAEAELKFTEVTAGFDGLIDRLYQQQGSLVGKGDLLTTLSDNSVMWVYFNVPEARYFEFKSREGKSADPSRLVLVDSRIELKLADGSTFKHDAGNAVTVEGKFNNETGNIQFRSDFPNPERLLRHGQTGTVLIHRTLRNAVVIPQRATFEVLDKQYVYVVDKENVARQRWITVDHEIDDIFVIKAGLAPTDRIVLEGIREIRDGQKLADVEFVKPEEALSHQKQHAE